MRWPATAAAATVPLHVRIGIAGRRRRRLERGDYFGVPVTEAARLDRRRPGRRDPGVGTRQPTRRVPLARPVVPARDRRPQGPARGAGLPGRLAARPRPVTAPGAGPAGGPRTTSPLAGREVELAQLASAWAKAEQGRCQVVVVAGEPGIGKTRLVTEAARRAHHDGGIVLYGRCDEGLGAPFRPVVEALRHVVDHLAASELSAVAGAAGPELVRLLPELADLLDGGEPTSAEPDVARVRLFDAVAAFVAALGARAPVLLALDDLQWADEASLLLLRHVVTRSPRVPVLVLATYRDTEVGPGHPLLALVADLRREDGFHRVALAGLEEQAVAALAAAADPDGTLDTAASAGALLDRTNGNPFFILQLVRHLAEEGAADAVHGHRGSRPGGRARRHPPAAGPAPGAGRHRVAARRGGG